MTNTTTAPVQSLTDAILAELDRAEKTHLDGEVRYMARGAMLLIHEQQALIAQQATPVAVPDEREAFEAKFPMPSDCRRVGNTYAATEFNAWQAQAYGEIRKGWLAALEFLEGRLESTSTTPAQQPVAWMRDDGSDVWTDAKKRLANEHAGTPGALVAQKYNLPLYSAPPVQQGHVEPTDTATRALHLDAGHLLLMDSALETTIDRLISQAYHHSRCDGKHYQDDALACRAEAARYQRLRDHIKAWKDGLAAPGDTAAPEQSPSLADALARDPALLISATDTHGASSFDIPVPRASAHDNLLDVAANGVTEGERLEALARWLEQQHFRPDVMSIAAADLRALYRRANEFEQDAQRERENADNAIDLLRQSRDMRVNLQNERNQLRAKCVEQDAVIEQRNAECSWKHHELEKLTEVIDRLVGGLEWALPELNREPFEWSSGDMADAHRAALQAIKDARATLGQDASEPHQGGDA